MVMKIPITKAANEYSIPVDFNLGYAKTFLRVGENMLHQSKRNTGTALTLNQL
jgi:hypothetical protein